ncbi:MAG TPA: hypothetical protein IAB56_05705 [Candidatus Scybalousia intestinigallinarum]|nr:hypothetical protein [Candidatus Scybalousia intestinigallinarum]
MKRPKIVLFLLFVICIILLPNYAEAAETGLQSKNFCLSNRRYYQVSWDPSVSTAVTLDKIDETAINNGFVAYPLGTTDLTPYKINVVEKHRNCYIDSYGSVQTCPTTAEDKKYELNNVLALNEDGDDYKNIIMELNLSNGLINIKIKDLFNGTTKIRYVLNENEKNPGDQLSTEFNNFLPKEGEYYVLRNVQPSTVVCNSSGNCSIDTNKIYFEFYINDSSSPCNNTYIASIDLVVNTADSVDIDNPALTSRDPSNSYGCKTIEDYIQYLIDKKIIYSSDPAYLQTLITALKQNYAGICYQDKITYSQYQTLREDIQKAYQNLQALAGSAPDEGYSILDTSNGFQCNEERHQGYQVVYSQSGTYWGITCWEKYDIYPVGAKLVYAGAGFTYGGTFKATRQCTIVHKQQVIKKPKCVYACETSCTYDENNGPGEGGQGGPNDDFDACVSSCDGGKYTQSCINSCYNTVYDNSEPRDLSLLDSKLEKPTSFLEHSIERTAQIVGTVTSTAGCNFTGASVDGLGNYKGMYSCPVHTEHCGDVGVTFSTYCDNHNGICHIYETVGPAGCVDNPDELYVQQLRDSVNELNSFEAIAEEQQKTGSYEINISDSYLKKGNQAYTYTVTSGNADIIKNVSHTSGCPGGNQTVQLGNEGNVTATFCRTNEVSITVDLQLPEAYVNKTTGLAAYKAGRGYEAFDANTGRLGNINFDAKKFYAGDRRYYTDPKSRNTNVSIPLDYNQRVSLIGYDQYFSQGNKKATITVNVDGIGTRDYSDQINCFYGVYNNLFIDPDDPTQIDGSNCPDCTSSCTGENCPNTCPGPNCPDGGTNTPPIDYSGITFIYRPIDLVDVFPNDRNPRWNWTNAAIPSNDRIYNLLGYKINPIELTEDIEYKGNEIYSDKNEVDYDIILTTEQIMRIRQYNKNVADFNGDGYTNYLDYDMSCSTVGGREVCTSNFLDDTGYVTYTSGYNAQSRKQIAVCNNAYGGDCDDD